MISVRSEQQPKKIPEILFSKDLMSVYFPFLDVKSVVKLLRVNKVVRTDMTAFLDVFRRPYVSLSTPIPANVADLQPLIETLERSVRDLGYGSDKVTMRLLPTPPRLTIDQLQAIPIIPISPPITIVYLLQNPANGRPLVAAGVHNPLSALLIHPQATGRAKEWAAGALGNLSADPANRQPLVVAGVHTPLSALLIDPQATGRAKQWAAEALGNLSADPANRQPLVVAGVHTPLSALLGDPQATRLAKQRAAEALRNLDRTPPPRAYCVIS